MKIYVIRHGETDANRNGILQGSSDWPLNEDGIKLAKITGEKMKGIKFDACFSSPLDRAIKTAELVLKYSENNVDIQLDDRLKEINMGVLEGKKFKRDKLEVPPIKMLLFHKNAFLAGRFKNGETIRQVCKRTQSFLNQLSKMNYENVLVSTHGCALRGMLNKLYKNKFSYWQGHVPYNCSVSIIEANNGKMKIIESDKVYYDSKYIVDRFNIKRKKK